MTARFLGFNRTDLMEAEWCELITIWWPTVEHLAQEDRE